MSDRAVGRRLLKTLLPRARDEAARSEGTIGHVSSLAESMRGYVFEDNLDFIRIYPAPLGGWHCDVVLKNVPLGAPNSLGTPVANPLPTRSAAEDHAFLLLVSILKFQQLPQRPSAPSTPVFMLYDWTFHLIPELFEAAVNVFGADVGYDSKDIAEERIEAILQTLCPQGHREGLANFNKWSWDDKADLLKVLHLAALTHVYVYPLRKDGHPEVVH
jgi:hypothetical protein